MKKASLALAAAALAASGVLVEGAPAETPRRRRNHGATLFHSGGTYISRLRAVKKHHRKDYFAGLRADRKARWRKAQDEGFGPWTPKTWEELRSTPRR